MKELKTMEEVWDAVRTRAINYKDESISVREMKFENQKLLRIGSELHPLTPTATSHMATRYKVPQTYLDRCSPELQAYNLNHWLRKERNDSLFVRFDGNTVRAIFTPKYSPVNHTDIVERLHLYGFAPQAKVQGYLDDRLLMLNLPDSGNGYDIGRDDRMEPGISIVNSEVGVSSLIFSTFVLRLICTNGMISKCAVNSNFRHVSRDLLSRFPQMLKEAKSQLPEQRSQWALSLESHVDDPDETFRSFNNQFNLSKREEEAVNWAIPQERGNTMFHVINTYTKAAQYPPLSTEETYSLQRTGGSILALLN